MNTREVYAVYADVIMRDISPNVATSRGYESQITSGDNKALPAAIPSLDIEISWITERILQRNLDKVGWVGFGLYFHKLAWREDKPM